jgi:membrane associated rhomboid family serine protease
MLDDRDYMRQPANDGGPEFLRRLQIHNWSWTVVILVVNVLVFLVECAVSSQPLAHSPDNLFVEKYFALSLAGLEHGYVWQLLTYQFMHAGLLHIFCNAWVIYIFGRILEDVLGGRNLLLIMLSGGVIGGLFQVALAVVMPDLGGPVVGASAGAFGLVAAFATLFPERVLTMLIYFVLPIRLRAKTLLYVSAAIAIGGIIFPAFFNSLMGAPVANAAHLGGMVMGVIYVRTVVMGRWFQNHHLAYRHQPGLPTATSLESAPPKFWHAKPVISAAATDLSADDLLKTQVDPILDKISAHGLQSLTAQEREILALASGKLAKR